MNMVDRETFCEDCGNILAIKSDYSSFCPECSDGYEYLTQKEREKVIHKYEEKFRQDRILSVLREYDKRSIVMMMLHSINQDCQTLFQKGKLPVADVFYYPAAIKRLLELEDDLFGEKILAKDPEGEEKIEIVKSGFSDIIQNIERIKEDSRLLLKDKGAEVEEMDDVEILDTNFRLSYKRNFRSIFCGDEDQRKYFLEAHEIFRKFEKRELDEKDPESVADVFYTFICQMIMIATSDEVVEDAYRPPELPQSMRWRDLIDFLHNLEENVRLPQLLSQNEVESIGKRTFSGRTSWRDTRNKIILDRKNTSAHPFLVDVGEGYIFSGEYSQILAYQIFPLVKNARGQTGKDWLDQVANERSDRYEVNIRDFFESLGYETFLNPEITKNNPNELDVIAYKNEKVFLVEAKYYRPKMHMGTREGIEKVTRIFNDEIFRKDSDKNSINNKSQNWQSLSPGREIRVENGSHREDLPEKWDKLEFETIVVSPIAPSYVSKSGIRFYTDFELLKELKYDIETLGLQLVN